MLFDKAQTTVILCPGGKAGRATIPASVTSIEHYAFYKRLGLTEINVNPNNTKYSSLDGVLFDKAQTTVIQCPRGKAGRATIPASITNLGHYAFGELPGLTAINVDTNNTIYSSVDGVLFNKDQTTLIKCPRGKDGIVTIPSSTTGIGDCAFDSCLGITNISVDPHDAYYSSLNGVLFNKDQTTLIQWPCGKAGIVTIPKSVTSIDSQAFGHCTSLQAINVEPNNVKYGSLAGVLFNKKLTKLIRCPSGKAGSVNIPANVISIGNYAFYHCHCLTSVNIPACVERIGWQAFAYCSGLTSVTIPKSVTSIGTSAFCNCSGLTRAFFAGKAPLMGTGVFGNTARGFTVYYHGENNNFTPPKWEGYAAEIIDESK